MGLRTARIAVFASMLLAITQSADAQVGRVAGTVGDEGGKPLRGASITAENREHSPSTLTATSNARGQFSILGLKRGTWLFTIQAPGYETARTAVDVVTVRPNPPLHVRLLKGPDPAPPSPLAGTDANDIQRRIDRAEALAAAGDLDGSIAEYRELLSRVPALTAVHLQIGALLERKQDAAGALAAYQQLLRIEPGNVRAQTAVARLGARP